MVFDGSGIPPMAGRVLGYLMLCDPPRQTAAEIGAALGASRGAVHLSLQLLLRLRLAERQGVPGHRGAHFRVRPEAFAELLRAKLAGIGDWRDLAVRGLAVLGRGSGERGRRLREMRDFYAFMERELPGLLRRWERLRR